MHETREHASPILHVDASASIPTFLNRNEFQIGTLQQYSPMRKEKENQYIDGTFQLTRFLIYIAWFTYSKSFHGCLHRPTFENNRSTRLIPNGPETYAFYSLFHAILGLGAFILAEHDRCRQFMRAAWTSLVKVLFTSQSLLTIQALQLLVLSALDFADPEVVSDAAIRTIWGCAQSTRSCYKVDFFRELANF